MFKRDETPKAPPSQPESKSRSDAPRPSGRAAVIGESLVVDGSIKGNEDLLVEGRVEGDVTLPENTVTVGETGRVKAKITAKVIIVNGKVDGDLHGGEQVEIRRSGNVLGNIISPRVGLEDGAQFKGNIDMSPKSRNQPNKVSTNEQAAEKTADQKLPRQPG